MSVIFSDIIGKLPFFCIKTIQIYFKLYFFQIMNTLYHRGLQSILVEGGTQLLQSFIDNNLWDEAFIEEAKVTLHSGIKAPEIRNKISYSDKKHFGVKIKHYTNKNM